MSRRRSLATAAVLGVVMLGASPAAQADPPAPDPTCAKQEAKVTKAEDALARVTAVFARQKDKVAQAEAAVAKAHNDTQREHAEKRLARAQAKAADTKKEKKAQKQRLLKAQERLDNCLAAQS